MSNSYLAAKNKTLYNVLNISPLRLLQIRGGYKFTFVIIVMFIFAVCGDGCFAVTALKSEGVDTR